MIAVDIANLYSRDLDKLIKEIEEYNSEESIWQHNSGINNSSGNLCLHLIGSINHFIGATLGKTGYIRERDAEFSIKGVERRDLINKIFSTKIMVVDVISNLTLEDLNKEFLFDFAGKNSTEYYLLFFAMHLNYHLGQINYHRRILDNN